jgi:uncharacterized protein (DUF4213/DUF364 family)
MLQSVKEKWDLYDRLIDLVPAGDTLNRLDCGRFWLMVTNQKGSGGLAPRPGGDLKGNFLGQNLKDLARLIKSWDFNEAALGLAAVNAAINETLADSLKDPLGLNSAPGSDAFDFFLKAAFGKKVAVVGHFPYLNRFRQDSELTILERNPQPGDLPDPAAEYILPQSDYVFLTGTTIINKTLPRLLELSQNSVITLVGPSTPLTAVLFDYKAAALAGLWVEDSPQLAQAIKIDRCEEIFKKGSRKINLLAENFAKRP